MVPLNALEQMDAKPLHLIGADAPPCSFPGDIKIERQRLVAERAHGQIRLRHLFVEHCSGLREDERGMKDMPATGESRELRLSGSPVCRFVEEPAVAGQRLVGAKHDPVRIATAHD